MASYAAEREITDVLAAAREWRDVSLLGQKSIFTAEPIWNEKYVAELDKYFVQSPDEDDESFIAKLEKQLKHVSPGAKYLAAEMIWVAKLFTSDVKGKTKTAEIRKVWAWSGKQLPEDHRLFRGNVLSGIGGTGVGFNLHFWKELVYFVELMKIWTAMAPAEQKRIVADPWVFGEWSLSLPKAESRPLRHMLCFLLFPEYYERIVSRRHKLLIAKAFRVEIGSAPDDADSWSSLVIDQKLLDIRKKLEAKWPNQKLDFYYAPLRARWVVDDVESGAVEIPSTPELPASNGAVKAALEQILAGYVVAKKSAYSGAHSIISPFNILKEHFGACSETVSSHISVNWSVGRGNWATVPWIAFLDDRLTESTVSGVYAVILFRADMSGFYLTLNQGVTKPTEQLGSEKAKEFMLQTADDVRRRCSVLRAAGFALDNRIDLRVEGGLGAQYALSTIAHKFYEKGRIPADQEILTDVRELLRAYNRYAEQPTMKTKKMEAIPLERITSEFAEALRESGLSFGKMHEARVRAFVASLATKRLVILTGLSGSGKTQIAIKFGEWMCPGQRWDPIPVRPDWTGPEAILGYEDALQPAVNGKRIWHVPRALQLILNAINDPDRPYLLVLDEMNLAHVERYFADLLSGMESGRECIPNLERNGEYWQAAVGPQWLPVPDNLFVVGTVNVDETTYMFSPKVLDRANTIEFRVGHEDLDGAGKKPTPCRPADESYGYSFLTIARDVEWHQKHTPAWAADFRSSLKEIHQLLSAEGFEFGHRVHFEACRFAAIHAAAGNNSLDAALDLQIIQKILPKLHGSRRQLEMTLLGLTKFCFHRDGFDDKADLTNLETNSARFPISFAKSRRMLRNIRTNQFASFTDS